MERFSKEKMTPNSPKSLLIVLMLASMISYTQPACAQMPSEAKVISMKGPAEFMKAGGAWQPLTQNTVLSEGDSIKTGKDAEVKLLCSGNAKTAELVVGYESEFTFKTFNYDPASKLDNTLIDVSIGAVLVKAEKLIGDSKFEAKTPTSIVGIRGTTFEVQVSKA